jgi:hypothetical protein
VGLTTATERVDASGQALADTRSVLRVSDACAPRAEGPGRPCAAAPSRPLAAGKRRCRTRSAYVVARTKSGRARGGPSAAMKSTGRRRTERWSRPRADHSRGRQRPIPGRGGAAPFDEIDPPLLCQHFDLDVNAAQPRSLVLDCLALGIGPRHRSLLSRQRQGCGASRWPTASHQRLGAAAIRCRADEGGAALSMFWR